MMSSMLLLKFALFCLSLDPINCISSSSKLGLRANKRTNLNRERLRDLYSESLNDDTHLDLDHDSFWDSYNKERLSEKSKQSQLESNALLDEGDVPDEEYYDHDPEPKAPINLKHGVPWFYDKLEEVDYAEEKAIFPMEPNAMRKLVRIERSIYQEMKTYVKSTEDQIKIVKNYIEDYEASFMEEGSILPVKKQEYIAIANPLVSYMMMRRFAIDMFDIYGSFRKSSDAKFQTAMEKLNKKLMLPDHSDHTEALHSILRSQEFTSLNIYELTNGKFGNLQTNTSFRPIHAYEIGLEAQEQESYALAVEWFEAAMDKFKQDLSPEDVFLRDRIQDDLMYTVKQHDKTKNNIRGRRELYFRDKIGDNFGPHMIHKPRVKYYDIVKNKSIEFRSDLEFTKDTQNNFISLCSGKNFQTLEEKSRLYCWYESEKSPYLKINPMKIELLHENPPILQIYDFIGPKCRELIIQKAITRLQRSNVMDDKDPKSRQLTKARTSSQTWLKELKFTFLQTVEKNIEAITGLRTEAPWASESFQIATYGTSHHYEAHIDSFTDPRRAEKLGDRIATFMIYLTDVDVGGKTGFPRLGTAANPIAGSAVFWYNLKLNGTTDLRTLHGGCPVVHGIKWVANKWILSKFNWDRRKCSLDAME